MTETVSVRQLQNAIKDDIGGGIVLRWFTFGALELKPGERLTEAEVRRIGNLDSLKRQGRIHVYSKSQQNQARAGGDTFVVHRGSGKYDVYGAKLNDEPLSKEEAEAFASPQAKAAAA